MTRLPVAEFSQSVGLLIPPKLRFLRRNGKRSQVLKLGGPQPLQENAKHEPSGSDHAADELPGERGVGPSKAHHVMQRAAPAADGSTAPPERNGGAASASKSIQPADKDGKSSKTKLQRASDAGGDLPGPSAGGGAQESDDDDFLVVKKRDIFESDEFDKLKSVDADALPSKQKKKKKQKIKVSTFLWCHGYILYCNSMGARYS